MMKVFGSVQLGFIIILLSSSVLLANPMDDSMTCAVVANNYLSHYKMDQKYHRSSTVVHYNSRLNVCFLEIMLSRNYRGKAEEPSYNLPAFIEIFDVRANSKYGTFLAKYKALFEVEICQVTNQTCKSLESFNLQAFSLIVENRGH